MTIAPYGSWKSPITTDLITSTTIGLGQIAVDGDNIYWSELRAWDKGRTVIVRRNPDGETTVTPDGFNVRSRVHEYVVVPILLLMVSSIFLTLSINVFISRNPAPNRNQ